MSGDNLDITSSQQTVADIADIPEPPKEPKQSTIAVPVHSDFDEGLSLGQKLFFLGVVVGICAFFLRSRGGKGSSILKEKSMA